MKTLLPVLAFLMTLPPTFGIVNVGNPLGNDTAPTGTGGEPDDPGFDSLGRVLGSTSEGTGIYLGNRWVLTADHVNAGTFVHSSGSYNFDGINSHQIGGADLRLFRLTTAPPAPAATLSGTSPSAGDFAVVAGAGRSPEASTTTWHVDTTTDPDTWSETSFPAANTTRAGYKTVSPAVVPKTLRWGTNRIEAFGTYGGGSTPYTVSNAFASVFDSAADPSQTNFEAQGVQNDSGGAFFVENSPGVWQVSGLIVTVGTFSGQPDGNRTAIFGQTTVAIDLSDYKTDIMALVPESANIGFVLGAVFGVMVLARRRQRSFLCRCTE